MLRAAIAAMSVVGLASCSMHPPVDVNPQGAAPENFSLDMTILTGPGADAKTEAHLKQSKFILFPDGSLRYGIDEEHTLGANWRPDVVRRLNRQQVQEVWALARRLGLTDPAKGDEPTNFAMVTAEPNQVVYLAAFTGGEDSWEFIRRSGVTDQPDPTLTVLARKLAQMAWATDADESDAAVLPLRYNFGPDPYARYRQPATAPAP